MAAGYFAQKINFHARRANFLNRLAKRRHARASKVANSALAAQAKKHPKQARLLLDRALRLTRMGVRAALRGQKHVASIGHLRKQRAAKHAV